MENTQQSTQPTPQAPVAPAQPAAKVATANTSPAPAQAYAGFLRRLGAFLVDVIILSIVNLPLSFLLTSFMTPDGRLTPMGSIIQLIMALIPAVYFVYFTYKKGATPGKNVLKIKVVREDGQPLTLMNVILRETINRFVASIIFNLGYLWIIWDDKKQGWHDKLAQTIVIRST